MTVTASQGPPVWEQVAAYRPGGNPLALDQGSAQSLGEGRDQTGQSLPALAQGQLGQTAHATLVSKDSSVRISPYPVDSEGKSVARRNSCLSEALGIDGNNVIIAKKVGESFPLRRWDVLHRSQTLTGA